MTAEEIKSLYPYLYETHMHTKEASACARRTGEEMVRAYKEYGYTGVIITDHNWGGNTCVSRDLPWKEWVETFFKGYEHAYEEGKKIGLDVFCGYEAGYGGPEFLIYGVTPEWVSDHEKIRTASVKEQLKLIHEGGGMVIQAHPFREEWYIKEVLTYPLDVDGFEIVNATHSNSHSTAHNDPVFDTRAIEMAKEYNLPTTAGSDMHDVNLFGGGIMFKTKLESIHDFIRRILSREDYVLTNGEHYYNNKGDLLA